MNHAPLAGSDRADRWHALQVLTALSLLIGLAWVISLPTVRWQAHAEPFSVIDFDDSAIAIHTRGTATREQFAADTVTLAAAADTPARAWFHMPLGEHHTARLRVAATIEAISASGIDDRLPAWWNLRLLDASGTRLQYAVLAHFTDDGPWLTDRIIDVPADAATAEILIHVKPGGGAYRLTDVSVAWVATTPGYVVAGGLLLLATLILAVITLRFVMRRAGAAVLGIALTLLVLVALAITLPTADLQRATGLRGVDVWLTSTLPRTLTGGSLLQFGHALGFAVLAAFACRIRRRLGVSLPELVAFVALLAVGTEVIQLHIAGRSTQTDDFLRDLGGAALVFLACFLYNQISMIRGTATSRISASSGRPRRQ